MKESLDPPYIHSLKKRAAVAITAAGLLGGVVGFAKGQDFERDRQPANHTEQPTKIEKRSNSLEQMLTNKIEQRERVEVLNAQILQKLDDGNTWVYEKVLVISSPKKGGGDPDNDLAPYGGNFYIVAKEYGSTKVHRESYDPKTMTIRWEDPDHILLTGVVTEEGGSERKGPDSFILKDVKGDPSLESLTNEQSHIPVGRSYLLTPIDK